MYKMPKYWNDVKEELPKDGRLCFVIYRGGIVDISRYNTVQQDWKPSNLMEVVFWREATSEWDILDE